MKTGNKKSFRR